jgi:molybdate transport system permease protein
MNADFIDLFPLYLSLKVAALSTLVCLVLGVGLAWVLARKAFPGRDVLDALSTLPLVLPPSVLGYYLLVALGRESALGRALESLPGLRLVFTWQGEVVAASVVALPLTAQSARAAFEGVDQGLEDVDRTLGRSEWEVFCAALLVVVVTAVTVVLLLTARQLERWRTE